MKRLRASIILISLILAIFIAVPALAISLPSSTPSVDAFYVYRNVLQSNDLFLLIYANIPYTTPPTTPVTQAFIWRLLSADGSTEYGNTVGYAYNNNGYGYNVYSMYFDNITAPSWGASHQVKLSGNPTAFTTSPEYNFSLSAANYSSLTTTADVQAEIAARILALAADLNTKWALTVGYFLTTETESGTSLSLYGEVVFRGAIYGLQAMAPAAFQVIRETIENPDRTWTTTYQTNLANQYTGTYIDTAKAASKELFKTDWDLFSMILIMALAFGILIGNIMLTGDAWSGLMDACVVMIFGGRLGMYGLGFLALLEALCIVWIGLKLKQQGLFGS